MANHHAAVLPLALDFGPDPGPAGAMYTEILLPEVSQGPGRHPAAAPGEAAERGAPGDPPSGRQAGARRHGDLRCAPGRAAPPLRSG